MLLIFYAGIAAYTQVFIGENYIKKVKEGSPPTFSTLTQAALTQPSIKQEKIKFFFIYYFLFLVGLSCAQMGLISLPVRQITLFFLWFCVLSLLGKIDFHTKILPDALTYPLWILGAAVNLWVDSSAWLYFIVPSLLFYSGCWILYTLSRHLLHSDVIGLGDIKLLTAIFCWLGGSSLLFTLLVACTLFLLKQLVKPSQQKLQPFGPFIVLGVLTAQTLLLS